jgi:hypothetical protein
LLRSNASPLVHTKAVAKTTGMSQTTSSLKDPKLRDLLQVSPFGSVASPLGASHADSHVLTLYTVSSILSLCSLSILERKAEARASRSRCRCGRPGRLSPRLMLWTA